MNKFIGVLLASSALLVADAASAAPFVPKSDADVLERLPLRPSDPVLAEVRKLRSALVGDPANAELAAQLALRYFDLANAQGDPRYIGYAEAALRPWPHPAAPVEILFARGLLRQYRHDFAAALRDLDAVLRSDPAHAGAHAWRAAIHMVQADYPAAAADCAKLAEHAGALLAIGCRSHLEAMTGKARAAYDTLTRAFRDHADAGPGTRLWVLTRLAEMAWRVGDDEAAERHFRQAFGLGLEDQFLLAAYADFLLERARPREVVGLLKPWTRSDTLLLRLALAERSLGMREADAHIQALGERFAAAALRGERLHMGEEARYLLELKGNAREALAVAGENWKSQREPRDAELLLEAAAAAREPAAAAPALRWLEESGCEGERLRRLAASLK
jgi:hypothetical protein